MYALLLLAIVMLLFIIIMYGPDSTQKSVFNVFSLLFLVLIIYNIFVLNRINNAMHKYGEKHGLKNLDNNDIE